MNNSVISQNEILHVRKDERMSELDILRGIGVIVMVFYHFVFDLWFFEKIQFPLPAIILDWVPKIIGALFLTILGISLSLTFQKKRDMKHLLLKSIKRSIILILLGQCITLASFILFPEYTISFGILHCIAITLVIAAATVKFPYYALLISFVIFILSPIILNMHTTISLLLPFGVTPIEYQSFDYYPLIPWSAFSFFGVFLGGVLYKNYLRHPKLNILSQIHMPQIEYIGRNALLMYIFHQPIIIASIFLVSLFMK